VEVLLKLLNNDLLVLMEVEGKHNAISEIYWQTLFGGRMAILKL
jgi:hypothetical protein